jgi:DNA-binding MarR family transcriptional regulator
MKVEPQDTIGFLIAQTHRSINNTLSETLLRYCQDQGKPYVVTVAQWGLLYLLTQSDGLTIGTISQLRHIEAPVVTNVVARLERGGLVERRHDREDRRVVKVYLTDEGREIMHFLPSVVENFYSDLIRDISPEDLRVAERVLRHLITNVSSNSLHSTENRE